MYCKKCGKELDDNVRFCDRCGQSVRQSKNTGKEAKLREIEELKKERLDRKMKQHEIEEQKKLKRRKNKKRTGMLTAVFAALFVMLVFALVSYKVTTDKSENAPWRTTDGTVELNATPSPEVAELLPTQTAYALTQDANLEEVNADGYREFKAEGIVFPYPTVFVKQGISGDVKLEAYDKEGGGTIVLSEHSPVSGSARDLMSDYSKSCTGEISYSRAGSDWYVIDYTQNGIMYHHKSVFKNNIEHCYDFTYSLDSVSIDDYVEYASYMDEHFTL